MGIDCPETGILIPLESKGTTISCTSSNPSKDELMYLPCIVLTSGTPWGLHCVNMERATVDEALTLCGTSNFNQNVILIPSSYVHHMHSKSKYGDFLQILVENTGVPSKLVMDGAKEQTGQHLIFKKTVCWCKTSMLMTEPYSP
eukprot:2329240-Ditylum_brightwellii.AAC.1